MTDLYKVTAAPSETPISLAEAKDFIRVDNTDDDTIITRMINTATRKGEKYTNRVFVDTEFSAFYDSVESSCQEVYTFVQVRRAPLFALTTIEISVSGSFTALTGTIFKETNGYGRVLFPDGLSGFDTDVAYPLKLTFTAGYGAEAAVPDQIKDALLEHVAFLYENRGDTEPESKKGIPAEVKALYSDFRILNTYGQTNCKAQTAQEIQHW